MFHDLNFSHTLLAFDADFFILCYNTDGMFFWTEMTRLRWQFLENSVYTVKRKVFEYILKDK